MKLIRPAHHRQLLVSEQPRPDERGLWQRLKDSMLGIEHDPGMQPIYTSTNRLQCVIDFEDVKPPAKFREPLPFLHDNNLYDYFGVAPIERMDPLSGNVWLCSVSYVYRNKQTDRLLTPEQVELLKAGFTVTGRTPSQPEWQELPPKTKITVDDNGS
jgi:hypothetical protein